MKLRKYQKHCVKLGVEKPMAFFLEMGLGKTAIMLNVIPKEPSFNIVISPISASHTWLDEVKKWRSDIFIISTIGNIKKDRWIKRNIALKTSKKKPVILLMNYEQAQQCLDQLKKENIEIQNIIADESSFIKNGMAKRTKACHKLRALARKGYALSGTPILHGPLDLYSQMRFVHPDILREHYVPFRNRYAIFLKIPFPHIKSYRNLDHLMNRIKDNAISIKKSEVAKDLPPKIYQVREIELSEKEAKHYKRIKKEAILDIPENEPIPITNALAKCTKLMQASSGFHYYDEGKNRKAFAVGDSKRKEVIKLLTGELIGQQVIVWTIFKYEAIELYKKLSDMQLFNIALNKTTKNAVKEFKNGNYDILIASPQSLGYGENLQCANNMIYLSNNFRYGDREQSESRCHRIGQNKPVAIIDIVAKNTFDNRVLNVLHKKESIAKAIQDELGCKVKGGDMM